MSSGVLALLDNGDFKKNGYGLKVSMTHALRGGVIVDVCSHDQARTAERGGALAVSVSDPAEPSRMTDPSLLRNVKKAVRIPVVSRARIGHFVEAQILEAVGVTFIDESERLSVADEDNFINKHNFRTPFTCGCVDLGTALRRIAEGAAMLRTEDSADLSLARTVSILRSILGDVRRLQVIDEDELYGEAKRMKAPYELVKLTKQLGRLPVLLFAAGGIATPADAALLMQIGADGIFVSNCVISESADPESRVRDFTDAVRNYNDSQILARVCSSMADLEIQPEATELVETEASAATE
eukprot:TRINITY_DN4313_c0_g1_i1.p1 TRINITY_DN4313_c0_g1~~TRINITY_DN4313_c0_g1_i1.p1  ORF type:complete len:298 (+),score=22.50 TRINITY_DN4313_c0_g1_i1:438-1331(+)